MEEILFENLEQQIQNWSILKVHKKNIYQKGSFKLAYEYVVHTVEQTESILHEHQTRCL